MSPLCTHSTSVQTTKWRPPKYKTNTSQFAVHTLYSSCMYFPMFLKGNLTQKWLFCSHLLNFMKFKTDMMFNFFMWKRSRRMLVTKLFQLTSIIWIQIQLKSMRTETAWFTFGGDHPFSTVLINVPLKTCRWMIYIFNQTMLLKNSQTPDELISMTVLH